MDISDERGDILLGHLNLAMAHSSVIANLP